MHAIESFLSDSDGTLLNTRRSILSSFRYALEQFGLPSRSQQELLQIMGFPLKKCYRILAPKFSDHELLCKMHRSYQQDHVDLISTFPNTKRALQWMKDDHIK